MSSVSNKSKTIFDDHLKNARVLICDRVASSRRRLMKTCADFGVQRHNILVASSLDEAKNFIERSFPNIIFSEFELQGGYGFDVFSYYREFSKESEMNIDKSVTVLITSNMNQSTVAKAAEEDVDTFILKPYTLKSFEEAFMKAVLAKVNPSQYAVKIKEGKDLLFEGEFEKSYEVFEQASKLNPKPSLALFYMGQARFNMDDIEGAESSYDDGLKINAIHYKCQVGLYELFMKLEKFDKAYAVVKNISKYFPANPDRLTEVIRLSIVTENYEDIEQYYTLFKDLENRNETVITYMCSGLFIAAKYYFQQKQDHTKALEVLNHMTISSSGLVKFISAAFYEAIKYNHYEFAAGLLNKFPTSGKERGAYLIAKYIIQSRELSNFDVINEGLELYNSGHKHPRAMQILLNALAKEGFEDKVKHYYEEAAHLWPDQFKNHTLSSSATTESNEVLDEEVKNMVKKPHDTNLAS